MNRKMPYLLTTIALGWTALLLVGCTDRPTTAKGDKKIEKKDDHSDWWCKEHGVPEHLCSLCSDEAAAKCKKEGDWCKDHERAKSQCFKCDPSKYKTFEDMYVAKYGKKPEPPPEDEFKK